MAIKHFLVQNTRMDESYCLISDIPRKNCRQSSTVTSPKFILGYLFLPTVLQTSERNHIQINTFYNFLLKILEFSDSILSPNFFWKTLMFLRSAKTESLDSTSLI